MFFFGGGGVLGFETNNGLNLKWLAACAFSVATFWGEVVWGPL